MRLSEAQHNNIKRFSKPDRSKYGSIGFFAFMAKQGFKGQWIEIAKVGKFRDAKGVEQNLTPEFFATAIANYSASNHDAPLVVGHPDSDTAPAFGWTSNLRLNGDLLEAQFSDTADEFEQLVADGRFKKRSASFYLDPPNLRHIGFLGAQPPAIKGLRDIQFADGETFTFVDSFINLQEKNMGLEDTDVEKVSEGVLERLKNFFKSPEANQANENSTEFSEAKLTELVKTAVAAATAEFTEKVQTLETANADLLKQVNGQTADGVRSEILSFVESIPAEKGKHFLKRAGITEFAEALAAADAKDEKPNEVISFSEGEGDDKQTHNFSRLGWFKQLINDLPPMIQFGEKFGNIVATKEADGLVNADRVNSMKAAAGVAIDGGAK